MVTLYFSPPHPSLVRVVVYLFAEGLPFRAQPPRSVDGYGRVMVARSISARNIGKAEVYVHLEGKYAILHRRKKRIIWF